MNFEMAREVGFARYIQRRLLWRISPPRSMRLPLGSMFPLPRDKVFASDVFVTRGNLDWNSEYILAAYLRSLPEKGDFLDVGAHIGYYSVFLSPLVSGAYAFEPDPRNHPYIRNSLDGMANAELIAMAVADRDGEVVLENSGESSVNHINPESEDGLFVSVVTIDSFVESRELRPVAVKIDIEGYDILALRGAVRTMAVHRPVFLVEYNQEDGKPNTWAELGELAGRLGLSVFAVTRQPSGRGFDYEFREHQPADLAELNLKMIFLVPGDHLPWFAGFSRKRGRWSKLVDDAASARSLMEP